MINDIIFALCLFGAYLIGRYSVMRRPKKVPVFKLKTKKNKNPDIDKIQDEYEIMLKNVDNYDGTPQGQIKL